MQPERDPLVRDQVTRLMGVLRQLAVARNRPIRQTSEYDRALWLQDVRDHCAVQIPEGPGEEVLRVARVPLEPEPPAPAALRSWLRGAADSDLVREPTLHERGPVDDHEVGLIDAPQVRATFEDWMTRKWRPWAAAERVRRPRLRAFDTLFELSRSAADRPESIELVLASGLLHAPPDVSIHVVTQPVRVEQDAATGEMVCRLADDTGLRLEDDELLSGLSLFDASGSVMLRDRLLDLAESPVALGVDTFLKEWAPRVLTIAHTVSDGWEQPSGVAVQVAAAPAIVARRRGAFALRAYYDAIIRSLQDDTQAVPLGLAQLVRSVETADRVAWLERAGATAPADLADDPLFPLPANEEQSRIIERLGADTGVVVEGPPGTGKTHTIANLVSALLARGQRVLVTSEKAQALRVLRDKLPVGMQELCVSITDASAKGESDLAKSVATMAGRHTDFDPARSDRRITDLAAQRTDARRAGAALMSDIRALRESETYRHPEIAPGYEGTLSGIARTLASTEKQAGWIGGYARGPMPVGADEFAEVLTLLRGETPRRRSRREQRLPDPPLRGEHLGRLMADVRRGDAARTGTDGEFVAVLETLPADALLELDPVCAEASDSISAMRALGGSTRWAWTSADRLLASQGVHLWQRAVEQLPAVDAALEHDRQVDFAHVRVAPDVDVTAAAVAFESWASYLASHGAPRRFMKSAEQKEAERLGDGVLVEGRPPRSAAAAAAAAHHLRLTEIARRLHAAFGPARWALPLDAERPVLVDAMIELRAACAAVDRVHRAAHDLRSLLTRLPAVVRPAVGDVLTMERIAAVALGVAHARSAALARAQLSGAVDAVLAAVAPAERSPELGVLVEALRGLDPAAYDAALAGLAMARREQVDQLRCDELLEAVRGASPPLAGELENTAPDAIWDERSPTWPMAWARACAASWMAEQAAPGREQRLDRDLEAVVADVHRLTGDLAAERAWRSCLARMGATQVQALQSYRNAMANVGKGTGKFAERYRRAARQAMTAAQSGVPAWVMPIQQVLASVPPDPDSFDVIIVDEASQADLTSAFLLWLAPRVIVVGDDKQCTPSEVASGALQPIVDRLDAELPDIPDYLRLAFTPKDSIFSLLRSRFGQVVRLREHFRCMPEIIEWSSSMFYQDAPLVPLRQFGADRLPPLRTTYVPETDSTRRHSSLVNQAEAAAIVDSVVACLDDPAYDGRTFGVVVLQGHLQADLIANGLRERIDTATWADRRLRVGTPPDFQGDERSIVWLSMVTAPDSPRFSASRRSFEQSYNVAASRAQDQLWLFHSVTADAFSTSDLRYSLLTYMQSKDGAGLEPVLDDVERDRRHPRFDSLFEQRVFLDLVARGYHVTPQVESNRRLIDLVVTGAGGKLAVECDGEAFHTTPEQREADLDREQELKRCGWTFERVRESGYHLDREAALEPVWAALERLGIEPLGEIVNGKWVARPARRPEPPPRRTASTIEIVIPSSTFEAPVPPPGTAEPLRPARQVVPADVEKASSADYDLARSQPLLDSASHEQVVRQPNEVLDDVGRGLLLQRAGTAPLTTRWVADFLLIGLQEARDLLSMLREEGALRRVGAGKGTRYVLPEWNEIRESRAVHGGSRERTLVSAAIHEAQVLRAARFRPLTRERVCALLDVTPGQATEILTALTAQARMTRRGTGRGTFYVLKETVPSAASVTEGPTIVADPELIGDLDRSMGMLPSRMDEEAGVGGTPLRRMLGEYGGRETVRRLLRPGAPAYGFVELWNAGRLDLTVEALVITAPRFHVLFDEGEIEYGASRLAQFGFDSRSEPVMPWIHVRGAEGSLDDVAWVMRRREFVQPWPHDDLRSGFHFLRAERRRSGLLVVRAEAAVTAFLPFVEVDSLDEAYRLARHILAPAGITFQQWSDNAYNRRRLAAQRWPLSFSCWSVDEQPVPEQTVTVSDEELARGTGWVTSP